MMITRGFGRMDWQVGLYDNDDNDEDNNDDNDDDNEGFWQDGWVGWPV